MQTPFEMELDIPVVKTWCSTHIEERKGIYEWTIHNFQQRREKTGESLASPTFSSGTDDKFKWRLKVFPKGADKEEKDFLSLFLQIVPGIQRAADAKLKFSILKANREEAHVKNITDAHHFSVGEFEDWGYKKFIRIDQLLRDAEELLPDDKLTIYCEVIIVLNNIHVSAKINTSNIKVPNCDLSDDFGLLFEDQTFCDVTLRVSGKKFQAHKAILAARSPVFKAMFEHNMKEKESNQVDIMDVDQEVFREMLRFMYTGRVLYLEKISFDLLAAADKYALHRLKAVCEEKLCANLSITNAAKILLLSDLHNANQMKTLVIDFINSHAEDVMKTSGWKSMVKNYPDILVDLYKASAIGLKIK